MSLPLPVEGYQMHSYALSGCTLNRFEAERQNKEGVSRLLQARLARNPMLVVLSASSSHVLAVHAGDSHPQWFFPFSSCAETASAPTSIATVSSAATTLGTTLPLRVKSMAPVIFVGEFPDTKVNLFVTYRENVLNALPSQESEEAWFSTRHHGFVESLPRPEQAALGLCLSLHKWHAAHSFCSQCGERTDPSVDLGFSRFCHGCKTQHFPRIMPAMIVAVLDGRGNVLLSRRSVHSPIYTVLSGFALLGESFEETVSREVLEESGAVVTFVRYIGSQPWPYPYLVMLVYYAVAPNSPELTLEEAELADVRWVSKEEVRLALEGKNPRLTLTGPGTTPYAMLKPWVDGLVDDWGKPTNCETGIATPSHL